MKAFEKLKYYLKELLFPKRCMCCGKHIHYTNRYFICKRCYEKQVNGNLYEKRTFGIGSIDGVYYAMKYSGKPKCALLKFKFGDKSFYGETFAKILYETAKDADFLKDVELVTCVPMSEKRLKRRGYNQADIIASAFSKHASLKYNNNLLIKVKDVPPLSRMNRAERFKHIKNAFKYNNENILFDAHVLLIDDIYTTGATTGECARVLKGKGVDKVSVLTVFSNEY